MKEKKRLEALKTLIKKSKKEVKKTSSLAKEFSEKAANLPKVFTVNWFRKDDQGQFMWPGFGDNMRVLEWILARCQNKVVSRETAIGGLPEVNDLNLKDLNLDKGILKDLLVVDQSGWDAEMDSVAEYLTSFGERVPAELYSQVKAIKEKL